MYLFHPSSDVYTCPLAMTDGAARCLIESGNQALIDRALPRLTARDPAQFWTSGQWMTETTGGSDVGRSQTRARARRRPLAALRPQVVHLGGDVADGADAGAARGQPGAAARASRCSIVEVRDANGQLNGIRVDRLKDKLGTRKVPTAELMLDGTHAELVGQPANGTRAIEPMLAVTRMWNSVCAVAFMRRGLALARSYAAQREAFGQPLARTCRCTPTRSRVSRRKPGAPS